MAAWACLLWSMVLFTGHLLSPLTQLIRSPKDLSPSSLDSFGFLNRRKGGFVPVCSPPSETTNFYFSEVDDTWEQRENILHPIAASFKPGLSLNCLCGGFEASLSAIFHHNLTASRQNGVII